MFKYCSKITERVLYSTIKNVMSQIFTNFEQEQLSISLLGGSLEIRDLSIRKEIFEDLSFPIVLSDGIVGRVNIDIVWRKIFTQEFVKITLDDVFLIFNTTDMKGWDVEMFEKSWKRVKANLLKQDEFITFLKSSVASHFLRQIGHFFISKIQFEIKNINFRIENLLSQYMKRFVIGLSIDTISSRNCNEYWIPEYRSGDSILGRNSSSAGGSSAVSAESGSEESARPHEGSGGHSHSGPGFKLDDGDYATVGSIVDKALVGGGGDSVDDQREQDLVLDRVLRHSLDRANGGKASSGPHNFWSKLKNTPLRWVWSKNTHQNAESPESLSRLEQRLGDGEVGWAGGSWTSTDMIFPYPNGAGISREIVDSYIAAKETREIERYTKDRLVQTDILEKHEIFLKSFVIENFSVYVDEISLSDRARHSSWTSLRGQESPISERIRFLKGVSAREADLHNFIIYPHKIELRARLVPCVIKYDENIYASALNDRFYILSQDEDNMVIPLISSYLIFDNLSIDITERQLKLLLDFMDYSVFLYGDFSAGSCPKDFENFPGEEPCIRYRLAWFEFLTGERDRSNPEMCGIEESYNAYSLIKLRNDVYKCLNYSIYHSVKSVLSFDLDRGDGKLLDLPVFAIKEATGRGSDGFPSKNNPVSISETDKISHHLAQYIVSKVVIGQNDHYSLSLNMSEYSQAAGTDARGESREGEIPLSEEERRLVGGSELLERIKARTRSLLSQAELPFEVLTFDLNSYLRSDKDEANRRSFHTSPFTLIFNSQNLTVNYSVSLGDQGSSARSRKSLRFNCLDLYFQYKLFTESKKSEITVAAENCYMVVHDDREGAVGSASSSNCLLRIGPNIQSSRSSEKTALNMVTAHPILHRSSIYTGTSICNRRPYRMFSGGQGGAGMHEPCERIGGFWLTFRLNKNPFRTTPKVSIHGKTYGEISVVGSYDVFERFLDPIVNHLSPKQRNDYLTKANKNFVKVIKKGQKLMTEFLNNGGGLSNFSDLACPNYVYLNIDAKAKQLLFFPILSKDQPQQDLPEGSHQGNNPVLAGEGGVAGCSTVKANIARFSDIMEYKLRRHSASSSMYCIDCGEMLIETWERDSSKRSDNSGDKIFIDDIKISFSNISLSFMKQVRLVDLYICRDLEIEANINIDTDTGIDKENEQNIVRNILKPQSWTFSVSKYRSSSVKVESGLRQFLVSLEFSLRLAEDTSVEISTTDLDLHNIAEIANYYASFYSQYNFINYSQVLVSNMDRVESGGGETVFGGRGDSVSSMDSMESIIAHSISKTENVEFLKNIEFVCTIPDTRIIIKSDRLYRERLGMAIKDLPVIKLNVSSIRLLILEGNKATSGVYVSIADVCLSGGILNRSSRLLVPLFCPISDTFCSLSIRFSDLSNIDRYKDFTGILLNNSNMDIQINNPRFIVYWDLYGIILNWIITFYFRSIAVHLDRKIDISNIKPILNGKMEDVAGTSSLDDLANDSVRCHSGPIQDEHEESGQSGQVYEGVGGEETERRSRECVVSPVIQFLSIVNLRIQFRNAVAILPCTLSDPIQVVVTETEVSSSSSSSASSSAVSSNSGRTQSNPGTGLLSVSGASAASFFKVDILKSLLAVLSCDLTYTFCGESVFEIETRRGSQSRLKSNVMKSTFELFKGSIQFGRSLTPRYMVEALGRISRSHNAGGRHGNAGGSIGVTKLGSSVASDFANAVHRRDEHRSVLGGTGNGGSIVTTSSSANQSSAGGGFQKLGGEASISSLIKSLLIPGTEQAWQSLLEIENLINSYQWQFNFDLGSGSENKIVSSLRFKFDFINNQLEMGSEVGDVVMLYGFLETVEIKVNANDLLQLINVVDMYYTRIQSSLFADLSNQSGQSGGGMDSPDVLQDIQSDYGSSRYNTGYVGYQTASSASAGSSSMMNSMIYLFPSIFHSTVISYSKFISQFRLEGLKIHYIPTNLTSNKDGVLIDVAETQLGLYVNNEAPNTDFLGRIFPFMSGFGDGSKRLMEEFEIRDKLLLIPRFSVSSTPTLPILPKSKDIFFGFILEFKRISVSIFNNQLMFYDNILEPFDVSLQSVCRGSNVDTQKISKEKVNPTLDMEITWINLTLTPEYVKYWLNCLDNFNEVYSGYYLKLGSTNRLISRRIFPYNRGLGALSQERRGRIGDGAEEGFRGLSARPLSGEWDDHMLNLSNAVGNRQVTGGLVGSCASSNFILYNDTGQTLAVLIPMFLDDSKSSRAGGLLDKRSSEIVQTGGAEESGRGSRRRGNSNLTRRRSEKQGPDRSIRESIFEKLLVRKKSVLDTGNLYSQDSEMSNISNVSKASYSLYYVWRYLKPNSNISFSRDEYGNSYPIVVRIRILNDVFDLSNITMDKVKMEVVYLSLSERDQVRIPLLIKTDMMDNHSFLISISSRVFISNNTSNIIRLLPSPKNVEEFAKCNFFIPPTSSKPILVSKYNNKFYEAISRKYIDKNYILSVLDDETNRENDSNDYINLLHVSYKYNPLRAVINNVWLESVSRRRDGEVSIRIPGDGEEGCVGGVLGRLTGEYLDVYSDLEASSQSIMQSRCYKRLFTVSVASKKKSLFSSSTIQLVKRLQSRVSVSEEAESGPDPCGVVSLCSSVCEYSQRSSRGSSGSFMFVVKLEIPIVIKNDLLIPLQLSFNKERERHNRVNSSIEQMANEREEVFNHEGSSNSGSMAGRQAGSQERTGSILQAGPPEDDGDGEEEDEDGGISGLTERVIYLNDSSRSNIHLKSNERILLESLPSCLSLSILDVSFEKFFGFYKSSQIQINYSSASKELSKEVLVPLKFSNGYKLLPNNELARINGASAVIANGFLPSSTCVNVVFESNRTGYVSKDFIPRQKQDLNYYMESTPDLDIRGLAKTSQEPQTGSVLDVSTPWNGYYCKAHNTCKVRLNVYAPFWINNRQHIPIYILQKSQIFSRFRLGSNEFRILPTNNGKSDLGVALNPELSRKCHSPFVHIGRANIVGTITVPSKKFSQIGHSGGGGGGGGHGQSWSSQHLSIRDLISASNLGLKLGYCVTTINNFSKSSNFMINIYNKYIIVNYHNLPIWVRESNKFGSWTYIPPNISIPFHPLDSKDVSVIEVTFLDPKIIEEYERRYSLNLSSIPYKTLPLSIDNLYDIQVRLVSSLNNIPLPGQSEGDGLPKEIGNLHFTYILSSISIYSINSSTSYQINIYPSQIPDFSIVNETPCSIFIRQLNTSCWNHFSPVTDSNYALLDPFGDHILELIVGVSLNNLEVTRASKRGNQTLHRRDHIHLGGHHNKSNPHRHSILFTEFSSIPLYLYTDQIINVWYKSKSNLNLNKVLTHSRIFIPEYNSMLYIVMLIENGTRVINISFDNTLYRRRRNEIRAMNQSSQANRTIRPDPSCHHLGTDFEDPVPDLGLQKGQTCPPDPEDSASGGNVDHAQPLGHGGKSIFKSLGNRLKSQRRHKSRDGRSSLFDYDDEDEADEQEDERGGAEAGHVSCRANDTETGPEFKSLPSLDTREAEIGSEYALNKITAVSSFETELSQFSNSNLSRVSSGQNLFLLVDRIRPETRICFELNIRCDGFGVSFLSNINKEITYMSFQKISFKLENSKLNLDQFHMRFRIMEFQLDNHITSSAENTIIRKATPNEFLRLSKISVRSRGSRKSGASPPGPGQSGESGVNDSDDEVNGMEDDSYYGVESLLSVGVAALGDVIKKKSEIIRIHNKLLEYMTTGTHEELALTTRERRIKGILCMESFLDVQFSLVVDNTNNISDKYGSNGVIEIPYLYFWMYPLSIHLDIDTLREMVSILDLLINRILSPTEELDNTKSPSLQSLPLVENLKKVSRYVYIQVLLMNPIQILCSTSKSTWSVSTGQSEHLTDYYNIMNNISKMGENEVIIRELVPPLEGGPAATGSQTSPSPGPGLNLKSLLNFKIMSNFGNHYLNFNSELAVNHASILERANAAKLGGPPQNPGDERGIIHMDQQNRMSVVGKEEEDGSGAVGSRVDGEMVDGGVGKGPIQNNLTVNKTGTEFLLNILQWLSSMPFSNVPIEFKGVINESMFLDSEKCLVQIGDLYRQQIFSHIGKIIGSIDLIGNPIDIYILLKEGLLASKYHFDLYKRATKLKEKIQENIQRKRMMRNEARTGKRSEDRELQEAGGGAGSRLSIEMAESSSSGGSLVERGAQETDDSSSEEMSYQAEKEQLDEQYQYILDFCYDLDESHAAKTYDEEVESFLEENKSLVLRSNAELMTKLVFFSIKEIMVGLHILVGTGIAVASQVVVRVSSAVLHLFEVTYLLDQECLMSIWYGTPLFMNRYLADNPNNLIEGLVTGSLRSLLILMSIIINFWQVPRKMYKQMGVGGVFLGLFLAFLRIVPAGFAALLTLFYGISSGVVQSLRTKIPVRHIRTVRVICNGSPILPYNPHHSIATMVISSLKLVADVKESNVVSFISFKSQGGGGSSSLDSNIDGIILNERRSVTNSGIEKKFLIYKLLENKDDSNLHYYNGIIIFKESISLLKSGKLVWMIPLMNISRINLYMVVSNASGRSEESNALLNRTRIKGIFYNRDKAKNRMASTGLDNLIDIESHFLGINRCEPRQDENTEDGGGINMVGRGATGVGRANSGLPGGGSGARSSRTFEFHLFVKPWSYQDDLSENGKSQYSKYYSHSERKRGNGAPGCSRMLNNGGNTGLWGRGISTNNSSCRGRRKRGWFPLTNRIMFKVHKWKIQRMTNKGINLFSDKKFMKQQLLPKKVENVQISNRFTIDEKTLSNLKTNNRVLNEVITPVEENRTMTKFDLSNNSFISIPSIPTSSFSSFMMSQESSSSLSKNEQFQLSTCKQFSEKITFTVEDKDDAIKIFSVLSRYINSE
ncbi:chorein/VPS13 like protein [Cryptosporidium canis]|nr:chorein/VPS13 like protein [Cryptosporidium canis]